MEGISWKNPWVLGAAGVMLILIIFSSRGAGGSAGAGGLQSQNIATDANVQLAGLSTQLSGMVAQVQGQVDITAAGEQTNRLGLALGWLKNMGDNLTAIHATDAAVNMNSSDNLTATEMATINQGTTFGVIDRTNSGALALATENNRTTIRVNGDNNALMATLSPQLASIQADTQRSLAETSSHTAQSLATIQANTRSAEIGAASQKDTMGGISGILGGLFGGITQPGSAKGGGSILGSVVSKVLGL